MDRRKRNGKMMSIRIANAVEEVAAGVSKRNRMEE